MVRSGARQIQFPAQDSLSGSRSVNVRSDSGESQPLELDESQINALNSDPSDQELRRSWFSFSDDIYCLNSYPNGITFSHHRNEKSLEEPSIESAEGFQRPKYLAHQFDLRLKETRDYLLPVGRYSLYKENYGRALEYHLSNLQRAGTLGSSVLYFGVTTDPFLFAERKGAVTLACLELLQHYQPGFLVVQTRSAKILSAIPLLKEFGERCVVTIAVESPQERILKQYTPNQPLLAERLFAADRLREEGIKVHLKTSPILPYGDFYRDAWRFAELLAKHGDFISFGSLASGTGAEEQRLRELPIARRLEKDEQTKLLRPFSFRCVYYAVQSIAPEKLTLPMPKFQIPSQLSLFGS